MKFQMPRRLQKSKKSPNPTNTPPNLRVDPAERSRPIPMNDARRAVENVRALSAATGEEFGLTILDRDEELIAWMNLTGTRMPSPASTPATSERRNAIDQGFRDWTSAEVAVLEEGEGSEPRSALSDAALESSTSGIQKYGNSGIEITRRIVPQGARPQVKFGCVDWNPPTTSRPAVEGCEIGPVGEVMSWDF